MWEKLLIEATEVLFPLVLAAAIALISYGIAFLRKQTEKINHDITQRAFLNAIAEAEAVAVDAVNATYQKFVGAWKEASEDGKLTAEEIKMAMNAAKSYFVSHMKQESLGILEAAYGPYKEWLEDYLEAKLGELRGGPAGKILELANPLS